LVSNEIKAQISQSQNSFYGQNKQVPVQNNNNLQKQNIIFDKVGKLASNLKYIHVAILLNISTFYEQGNIQEISLKNLANITSSKICHIPFTKAARDRGVWGLIKLSKMMIQVITWTKFYLAMKHRKQTKKRQYSQKAKTGHGMFV
jgi:hypothetical protein